MRKNRKTTRVEFIILLFIVILSVFLFVQANAYYNVYPSVTIPIEEVLSNTISAPNEGVSNPGGKYPPGHNK